MQLTRTILFIIVLLFFFARQAFGQTELHYLDSGIKEDFIPYNEKFTLTGSTELPEGEAQIVTLEINSTSTDEKQSGTWIALPQKDKQANNTSPQFEFLLNPLTGWKCGYTFILKFYIPKSDVYLNSLSQEIVAVAKKKIIENWNSKDMGVNLLAKYLDEAVKNISLKYNNGKIFYFNDNQNLKEGLPTINFPQETKRKIFVLIAEIKSIDKVSINSSIDSLNQQIRNLKDSLVVLYDSLKNFISENKNTSLTKEDILKLSILAGSNSDVIDDNFYKKFNDVITSDKFAESQKTTLEELLFFLTDIKRYREKLIEADAFPKELDKITFEIPAIYQLTNTKIVSIHPWTTPTNLSNWLIGTNYGYGATALSTKGKPDFFSFVGLKFYFGPVNYDWIDPYPTSGSRLAITLSAVFLSDITYLGQKQDDLFGTIKPMIGISYDIQPKIVLNFGLLFFRQPNINPLATNTEPAKISPYFGISFDIDVLNRLKNLIKP